jgi:hypothetical protein
MQATRNSWITANAMTTIRRNHRMGPAAPLAVAGLTENETHEWLLLAYWSLRAHTHHQPICVIVVPHPRSRCDRSTGVPLPPVVGLTGAARHRSRAG